MRIFLHCAYRGRIDRLLEYPGCCTVLCVCVCGSFHDSLEARPPWCSAPLDHSSSLSSFSLFFSIPFGKLRAIFNHQSGPSTSKLSILNCRSVSPCTVSTRSACHTQGYTYFAYHKVTSQQGLLSLRRGSQGLLWRRRC